MPPNSTWAYQQCDMTDKKVSSITCSCLELHQTNSSVPSQKGQAVTPGQWPIEPGSLAADRHYDILMNVYDTFLCAIPLFLIAKTSLCIFAHQLDIENRGLMVDRVSSLTIFLLRFNDQVSLSSTSRRLG